MRYEVGRYLTSVWTSAALLLFANVGHSDEGLPQPGMVLRVHAGSAEIDTQSEADSRITAVPSGLQGARFVPPESRQRPKLVRYAEHSVMRFDGEDDCLRLTGTGLNLRSATVFLVASPRSNAGGFRGLFAANAAGQRDYESGLTIDLGPGPGRKFDYLNAEGRGFGGAADVNSGESEFGTLHVLEMIIDADRQEVRCLADGKSIGQRAFRPSDLSLDELTLGARYYTNGPGAQQVRGHFDGDIAELVVYDRVLTAAESDQIREYLTAGYASLKSALADDRPGSGVQGIELVRHENPDPITMLVPGFEVRELPVELTNCNNVRYREDGVLVTLGYNGDIHLLRDTDGDGLEDSATLFSRNEGSLRGPIGMLLTPPGYEHGRGAFVPSKGKVSLITDTDGDDKADKETIVASGWDEIPQNVDALGAAMDADGNLYFGLGVANYADAYQIDEQGISQYDIRADNGTIQKVSADFQTRETVCTGIRFPVALAFSHDGDLFCTEQEGATWLPNGNPFDELLHIPLDGAAPESNAAGLRHFGFPPRHPRHNPGVIDEPAVFNYGPQHQSTCGMVFNEPVNGGPVFGPEWWQHDAIVCGESRGKIWRTSLVRTESGYVADSQLIACLQMLTVDACVSPNGDLVVACHSGPPDWGTGPTGIGKLFQIRMTQPETAKPVRTWASGPQEIRVAFDRPVDPTALADLAGQTEIRFGTHVRAGDRYEHLVPPYAVVQAQQLVPRYPLEHSGGALTADRRTLILNTAPMTADAHYAVTIPLNTEGVASQGRAGQIETDFALRGVAAQWSGADSTTQWTGVLPHTDMAVNRRLMSRTAEGEAFFAHLRTPGRLILTTQLQLRDMLRPAVQPGSSIDYTWPEERTTIVMTGPVPFRAEFGPEGQAEVRESKPVRSSDEPISYEVMYEAAADPEDPLLVRLEVETGAQGTEASSVTPVVSWFTNEDSQRRALSPDRLILPWVRPGSEDETRDLIRERKIAELEGGSWGRGRRVFHSDAAACYRCHAVDAGLSLQESGYIGPDLKNLIHRDYQSVVRDILHPSYAINPDYTGQVVQLKSGRVLTGVLRTVNGQLLLGDAEGRTTVIRRSEIEAMYPASVSVMPEKLTEKLTDGQLRDLLTYLMTPPPQMPADSPLEAPPLRTRAEVAAALAGAPEDSSDALRPLTLVLVAGPKDHGPGEHDYPAWQQQWSELLAAAPQVTVEIAQEFPSDEQLARADVLLFFQKGSFSVPRPEKLDQYLQRGGGAVYLHWAVNGNDEVQEFSRRIGYASWGGRISYRHGPLTLEMHNTDHPILRNFERLQLYDESYWKLTGDPTDVTLLATSQEDGMPTPQMWVREHNPGRVFVSIPGHYSWTFDDPLFRVLLLRGVAWTAGESVDRFNDLVTPGARISR